MLESVKIQRRQSEIRQSLASLAAKEKPSEDETRSMESLDAEYRGNEVRYRASLIAEDTERRDATGELETRGGANEWATLVGKFEMRQVALALDEGAKLDGATAEVVQELRDKGGYRGIPVPWDALETRAGETVAADTPDPIRIAPIIDRLFADSVAMKMGASVINVDSGSVEYPVTTSNVTTGWAASETGNVGSPAAYQTTNRPLAPNSTLGVQMRLTRKTLKQSGDALEQAVRRDMNGAISEAMDRAVFLGSGAGGQPTGVITLAAMSGYDILTVPIEAAASWAVFRAAVTQFMIANAATSPDQVSVLIRPEVWDAMDDTIIVGTAVSEWDRFSNGMKEPIANNIILSANALEDPQDSSPAETTAVLTTSINGTPPIFVGTWGAIDLIRDPYSDAASGGLRLTALATMDVTISRAAQVQVLTGIQV